MFLSSKVFYLSLSSLGRSNDRRRSIRVYGWIGGRLIVDSYRVFTASLHKCIPTLDTCQRDKSRAQRSSSPPVKYESFLSITTPQPPGCWRAHTISGQLSQAKRSCNGPKAVRSPTWCCSIWMSTTFASRKRFEAWRRVIPDQKIAVISQVSDVSIVVRAMRLGAVDYI